MQQEYVILRSKSTHALTAAMPSTTAASRAEAVARDLSIHVERLESVAASGLKKDPEVLAAAPAYPMRLIEPLPSNAALPSAGTSTWGIRAVKADASPFDGDGVVVAVLDTGIDGSHAAFKGIQIVERDFTGEGNGDLDGHGTHCAGTIFGRDVNGVRIGVARGVKKALIGKVLGQRGGDSPAIVSAIEWAVKAGARIVSMSLGIDFPGYVKRRLNDGWPPELATSEALDGYRANVRLFESVAQYVSALGGFGSSAVLIAAAGNESRKNLNPLFKISVSPPAVASDFISVAALGEKQGGFVVADFSNVGATVAAPGVDISSAKAGGGLHSLSGTSMAAPHVAGVAALWAQKTLGVPFDSKALSARLVGNAIMPSMAQGKEDIGSGLVVAPTN